MTFTAYHLKEIAPLLWEPMYVYISLDTPEALARVQMAAKHVLSERSEAFRQASAHESTLLRRGTRLTISPEVTGFQFDPAEMTIIWKEDVQGYPFKVRALAATPGVAVNGSVRVFTGFLLLADIPISIFVRQTDGSISPPRDFASTVTPAYRKVFASYSHRDMPVVQSCEMAIKSVGDTYLRDITILRSGEKWDPRLQHAIDEADVFQLFWSKHSAQSEPVEKEWRYALESAQQGKQNFIKPVYWSKKPYTIPTELQSIHFAPLSLSQLGWGRTRIFVHTRFGAG